MSYSKEKSAAKTIILTLAFIIIAVILFFTAFSSVRTLAMTKINMAVDLGSPVYEYTGIGDQPSDGEIDKSDINIPAVGSRYGTILCDRVDLKAPLYFGDSDTIFSKGAGQYVLSGLPGEGKPILIGAHDMGYFAPLEDMEKGDIIDLSTSYGEFKYEVSETGLKSASSYGQTELNADREELVLYTCYPFGSLIKNNDKRYFVIAEKASGPVIVEK